MLRRRAGGAPGPAGGPAGEQGPSAYRMRQQMFSIGDDFWIEAGVGRRAFHVDGKALRARETLILRGPDARELYKIQQRVRVRDTMEIEGTNGTAATVKKAMIAPMRERFTVDVAGGRSWEIQGNLVDHEYEITGPGGRIASISKRWFRVADSYGVEVGPGQDDALVLAAAIVVDEMAHPGR
jgi:uncharacterized protein YxjI